MESKSENCESELLAHAGDDFKSEFNALLIRGGEAKRLSSRA